MPAVDRTVARIVNHAQRPNWYVPWDAGPVQPWTGSGFVIDGGLILTNAHVVSDSRMLLVFLYGDPDPHPAVVHAIGHDCDLALLRLVEPGALDAIAPLPFGGLPPLRAPVETFGYPVGGRQISSTRGVVSRIEVQPYAHPQHEQHLVVQTDAAINPGNSGGPVVRDGRVVGVAFQAASHLQSVGYFIPTEVVQHFLDDAARGAYAGFPSLGVRAQRLENPAARRHFGLCPGDTGVVVDFVFPGSSADGRLLPDDVLRAIDGVALANDGSVALRPFEDDPDAILRLDHLVLIDRHHVGEDLRLDVLRGGRPLEVTVALRPWPGIGRYGTQHDVRPRYFVYGGLVFVPLDLEMLRTFGEDWRHKGDKHLLYEYLLRPYAEPERGSREPVVLLRRLDHPVNSSLSWFQNLPVERVDGDPVTGLEDLVARLTTSTERFQVFEFPDDRFAVLDRLEVEAANDAILTQYGVPVDRCL